MSKPNRFYIVDFDRTTFRTVEGADVMASIIEESRPDLAALLREKVVSHEGKSFSMHALISEHAGDAYMEAVEAEYLVRTSTMDMLHDGARELFAWLDQNKQSYGILTYGGQKGQGLKLTAAGMSHVPTIITKFNHKGAQIASWKNNDGGFDLPNEFAQKQPVDEIILIDDRQASFVDLPEGAIGYRVMAHAVDIAPDLVMTLPETVRTVNTLHDVIIAESERLQ